MKIFATITAVDTPSAGYYQARTCFGTIITGVSLKGPAFPLVLNQQVAVFEVGGQFGSLAEYGLYPSLLTVPGNLQPGFCKEAPAKASLAYLAYIVKNFKKWYAVGTVTGLSGSNLIVGGKTIQTSGVNASDFSVGDQVLIDQRDRSAKVIGWWSLKAEIQTRAAFLHRPFFTANAALYEYVEVDNVLELRRSLTFFRKNPASVRAVLAIQQTTDAADYYYCTATMSDASFNVTEFYYLAFAKDYSEVIELTAGQYPPDPGTPYSRTVDNKYWWNQQADIYCLQSDTVDGAKYKVFNGQWDNEGLWLPSKGQVYAAI